MTTKTWTRALITGASGGIGEAFARRLAAAGTDIVLVARSKDRLEQLGAELSSAHGIGVEVLVADLGDREQLAPVERRVLGADQPVDLLVNNAGYGYSGSFSEIPVDDEDAEIRVNVLALVRLCHAAVSRMKHGAGGGILNISSTASFQPGPGSANYAATKAYVSSLSQALHEENRGAGIHVSVLCPGLTRTGFQARGGFKVSVPPFLWQSADEVAGIGLDAVATNKAVVVAGVPNKALAVGSRLMPMGVARWTAGQVLNRVR